MPLSYTFGFVSVSSGQVVPLQSRQKVAELSAKLARGNEQLGFKLTCVLHVYDSVDARSDVVKAVKVSPSGKSRQELSSAIDNFIANDSLDFEQVFGPLLESVTEVNCTLSPDCYALYNRQNCSAVVHTCGPCVSTEDFFGEDGHHNSRCAPRSTLRGGDHTTCSSDLACPAFQSCREGHCTAIEKECTNNCSGHGECRHVDKNTGMELEDDVKCVVGDTSCSVECSCESQWYGKACLRSESDMTLDLSLIHI